MKDEVLTKSQKILKLYTALQPTRLFFIRKSVRVYKKDRYLRFFSMYLLYQIVDSKLIKNLHFIWQSCALSVICDKSHLVTLNGAKYELQHWSHKCKKRQLRSPQTKDRCVAWWQRDTRKWQRYKKRHLYSVTTDEEERSQTGHVNSITLNTLRKVNKGGGYCHKKNLILPPCWLLTGDPHPVLIPHTLQAASQISVIVHISFPIQQEWTGWNKPTFGQKKLLNSCEISGSHSGKFEDNCLIGCYTA